MNLVSELDLPAFDYTAPDFSADRYHQQLAETRQRGWLAKSPLAYIVLDHDAGEFFLRSRKTVAAAARVYPALAIATVLGAPLQDAGRLHTWSTWVQRQFDWAGSRAATGSTSSRSSGRVHPR